jgi:hypothetical protein
MTCHRLALHRRKLICRHLGFRPGPVAMIFGDSGAKDQVFGRKAQVSRLVDGYVVKVIAATNATRRDTFPESPSCLVSLHRVTPDRVRV